MMHGSLLCLRGKSLPKIYINSYASWSILAHNPHRPVYWTNFHVRFSVCHVTDDRNRGSSKVDTPRGDWGSLEPAAPGVSRGEIEAPAPSSTGAWNQGKDSEPEASDWGQKVQPPASTGDAWGKESEVSTMKTSSNSGWDVPAESNGADGWGELSPVASGGGDKASGGWDQLDSSPGITSNSLVFCATLVRDLIVSTVLLYKSLTLVIDPGILTYFKRSRTLESFCQVKVSRQFKFIFHCGALLAWTIDPYFCVV